MSVELSVHRVHKVIRRPYSGEKTFWTTLAFLGQDDTVLGELTLFHAEGIESLPFSWERADDDLVSIQL